MVWNCRCLYLHICYCVRLCSCKENSQYANYCNHQRIIVSYVNLPHDGKRKKAVVKQTHRQGHYSPLQTGLLQSFSLPAWQQPFLCSAVPALSQRECRLHEAINPFLLAIIVYAICCIELIVKVIEEKLIWLKTVFFKDFVSFLFAHFF